MISSSVWIESLLVAAGIAASPQQHARQEPLPEAACGAIAGSASPDPAARKAAGQALRRHNRDCWEPLRLEGRRGSTAEARDAAKAMLRELTTADGIEQLVARHVKLQISQGEADSHLVVMSDRVPYLCGFMYQDRYPRSVLLDVALSKVWTDWRSPLVLVKPATVNAWHRRAYHR